MSGLAPVVIPVLSTILTAITLFALRWVFSRIKDEMQMGRAEQMEKLTSIEGQTTKTNGRVTELEHARVADREYMDGQNAANRERLAKMEGQMETLYRVVSVGAVKPLR